MGPAIMPRDLELRAWGAGFGAACACSQRAARPSGHLGQALRAIGGTGYDGNTRMQFTAVFRLVPEANRALSPEDLLGAGVIREPFKLTA